MKAITISNIEVISDALAPIYCAGYFIEPSDIVHYKTYQLKDIINYVSENCTIKGVYVIKSQTITGEPVEKQHIVDYIEHNYRSIIKKMINQDLKKGTNNAN